MNRCNHIRGLRGAAWLILIGVLALLNQWRILSWGKSWPFFLIVPGVLMLAERAAWTADLRDRQADPGIYAATPVESSATSAGWTGVAPAPPAPSEHAASEPFARKDW